MQVLLPYSFITTYKCFMTTCTDVLQEGVNPWLPLYLNYIPNHREKAVLIQHFTSLSKDTLAV